MLHLHICYGNFEIGIDKFCSRQEEKVLFNENEFGLLCDTFKKSRVGIAAVSLNHLVWELMDVSMVSSSLISECSSFMVRLDSVTE